VHAAKDIAVGRNHGPGHDARRFARRVEVLGHPRVCEHSPNHVGRRAGDPDDVGQRGESAALQCRRDFRPGRIRDDESHAPRVAVAGEPQPGGRMRVRGDDDVLQRVA
jgi:hypothetical protein